MKLGLAPAIKCIFIDTILFNSDSSFLPQDYQEYNGINLKLPKVALSGNG